MKAWRKNFAAYLKIWPGNETVTLDGCLHQKRGNENDGQTLIQDLEIPALKIATTGTERRSRDDLLEERGEVDGKS